MCLHCPRWKGVCEVDAPRGLMSREISASSVEALRQLKHKGGGTPIHNPFSKGICKQEFGGLSCPCPFGSVPRHRLKWWRDRNKQVKVHVRSCTEDVLCGFLCYRHHHLSTITAQTASTPPVVISIHPPYHLRVHHDFFMICNDAFDISSF